MVQKAAWSLSAGDGKEEVIELELDSVFLFFLAESA